ncbi:MAG: histidine kinase, partial [Gammaproteobacteria bacterium]|nr:histidine kinase [Gammaproteobacteria bacterium]
RSEGQFNTIIYSEEDVYRGQAHRQVLFMNPEDIEEMGFSVEEKIDVSNETGIMRNLELAEYSIRRGNVMCYFPEANVLIPQQLDVRSRTPSFKSVSVQISKSKKKTA